MVEENLNLFDVRDDSKLIEAIPLVNEPYTYDNMVSNPIIKPIAEADRSIRDMEEMEYKKLIDIKRLKTKINTDITDVSSYQDSPFIANLINMAQYQDDIIKIQDIIINQLKGCVKNVHNEVRDHYGVRIGEAEEYSEPTPVIPEGSIMAYLEKLCGHRDEKTASIAKEIKEIFIKTEKGKDENDRFENAGTEYYSKELDKEKRRIAAQIMRMEIK